MNESREKATRILKTVRGQVDGIIRMIEEERYCVDISNQILASESLLRSANSLILKQHLNSCVISALEKGGKEEKMKEIADILAKLLK